MSGLHQNSASDFVGLVKARNRHTIYIRFLFVLQYYFLFVLPFALGFKVLENIHFCNVRIHWYKLGSKSWGWFFGSGDESGLSGLGRLVRRAEPEVLIACCSGRHPHPTQTLVIIGRVLWAPGEPGWPARVVLPGLATPIAPGQSPAGTLASCVFNIIFFFFLFYNILFRGVYWYWEDAARASEYWRSQVFIQSSSLPERQHIWEGISLNFMLFWISRF